MRDTFGAIYRDNVSVMDYFVYLLSDKYEREKMTNARPQVELIVLCTNLQFNEFEHQKRKT